MGIVILFPNGASLGTANGTGELNVTSDGRILSNSLDPATQNNTWVALAPITPANLNGSFPVPGLVGDELKAKSWRLTKSAQ